jgi:IPT/TIG domain/RTX calcium-binding nonapeptide repeat (4 copies)
MKKAVLFAAVGLLALGLGIPAAQAAPFTGTFSPTVVGGLADLNGSGTISSADSWVDFYDNTDIINGGLDCDNWGSTPNDGSGGDGVIDFQDDCQLIGYDGTVDGVTINVSNGNFVEKDGLPFPDKTKLPAVFNATSPGNPSVVQADFAWQAIGGAIDVNQNGLISAVDCAEDIVNGWNIVASLCNGVPSSDNGLVDTTDNFVIGTEDDSASGFFGMAVVDGVVQAGAPTTTAPFTFSPTSGAVGTKVVITGTGFVSGATVTFGGVAATCTVDSATQITCTVPAGALDGNIVVNNGGVTLTSVTAFDVTTPTPAGCTGTDGNDTLTGTGGADTCVGKAGNDTIMGKGGPDLLKGNQGDDVLKGGRGDDVLKGGKGFDVCKGGKGNDTLRGCEA